MGDVATVPPAGPAPEIAAPDLLARGVAALEQIAGDVAHIRATIDHAAEQATSGATAAVEAWDQLRPVLMGLGQSRALRAILGGSRG